jgi:SWI/SNF-related matrix-associated actin-dependent regulator of chromatin subfamily A member 5
LDFENAVLIGETLKEYEILGFGQISQAFYIECPACREHHRQFPEAKVFCANMAAQYDRDYASNWPPSRDESLTDATTLVDSGISTPRFLHSKDSLTFSTGKSKLGSGSLPTNIQSSTQVT